MKKKCTKILLEILYNIIFRNLFRNYVSPQFFAIRDASFAIRKVVSQLGTILLHMVVPMLSVSTCPMSYLIFRKHEDISWGRIYGLDDLLLLLRMMPSPCRNKTKTPQHVNKTTQIKRTRGKYYMVYIIDM